MAEPGDKRVFIHTVDVDGNITAVNNERVGVDVLDEAAVNLAAQHMCDTKLIHSNEKGATLNA